jgi:hypothetical protein
MTYRNEFYSDYRSHTMVIRLTVCSDRRFISPVAAVGAVSAGEVN